ncbi:hypothetical protein SCG7086_AD_00200 [Chlamydiales bacterium SCGC AG-110-P3]|nr:hypothetical protein SCG7086_AD_00200 [Chlamydiales bacterium SCGC AG-110-P3]
MLSLFSVAGLPASHVVIQAFKKDHWFIESEGVVVASVKVINDTIKFMPKSTCFPDEPKIITELAENTERFS